MSSASYQNRDGLSVIDTYCHPYQQQQAFRALYGKRTPLVQKKSGFSTDTF